MGRWLTLAWRATALRRSAPSIGARRSSSEGFVGTTAVPEDLDRDINSVYGELFVPIFGDGNKAPLFRSLSLSLSGRYDHYGDFGSTTNPKVGLNWESDRGRHASRHRTAPRSGRPGCARWARPSARTI